MDEIRVLVVDDQDIIRQGISTILKYTPGMVVVGQAANGREAIDRVAELAPDVVLMDVMMPVLGGIPATREIVKRCTVGAEAGQRHLGQRGVGQRCHVIILTTYDTDDLVFEGIKAGAEGYLLKDADSEALIAAIRGVVQGESQLDTKVARSVLAEFQRLAQEHPPRQPGRAGAAAPDDEAEPLLEALTPREEDVLKLLVEGLSNKQIGARLYLTEGTIKNHVSAIINKLQANDRTHAVVTALRRGLARL